MAPVSSAFDYMFFIYLPERTFAQVPSDSVPNSGAAVSTPGSLGSATADQPSQVVLLILKRTSISVTSSDSLNLNSTVTSQPNQNPYFFCNPSSFTNVSNRILPRLANLAKPLESRIYLSVFQTAGIGVGSETFNAQANLILWTPTQFSPDELTLLNCQPAVAPPAGP